MTTDEIVDRLVVSAGLNRVEAYDFVTMMIAQLKRSLAAGHKVRLPGFGTFAPVTRSKPRLQHDGRKRDIELSQPTDEDKWRTVTFTPSAMATARAQRALVEETRRAEQDADLYAQFVQLRSRASQ